VNLIIHVTLVAATSRVLVLDQPLHFNHEYYEIPAVFIHHSSGCNEYMILDLDLNVIMRTWACLPQVKDRRVYNVVPYSAFCCNQLREIATVLTCFISTEI
jgi:hypothetical protein